MDVPAEAVLPEAVAPVAGTWSAGALEGLFRSEAPRLVQIARWFTDDRTAAEDLVQEAFIRLARSGHRIRDPERAAAYLRTIVVNLARDHNRRGFVSRRHRPPAVHEGPSAEDLVAQDEDRREVVAALRALAPRQRDCIVMRYYLEMGVEDVAHALGLSPNSVKTHLRRGLRALEHQLEATR